MTMMMMMMMLSIKDNCIAR